MQWSSIRAVGPAQNRTWQNFCWAWINAHRIDILLGLMLCSKMNTGLDAGPAQLCAVALSHIRYFVFLTGRIKNFILYSHKFCRTKLPSLKRWGNRPLFWPCTAHPEQTSKHSQQLSAHHTYLQRWDFRWVGPRTRDVKFSPESGPSTATATAQLWTVKDQVQHSSLGSTSCKQNIHLA